MKLHLTKAEGNNLITAYQAGEVSINHQRYQQSLIVCPDAVNTDWQVENFEKLTEAHFAAIAAHNPEVIVLGTGDQHHFVHPRLTQALTNQGLSVECMRTDAACRTYNILMSEGRHVVAALILK